MNIKKIFIYSLVLVLFVIISPQLSFGQSTINGSALQLTLSPENPMPSQNVKFTLQSFTYDLDRLKITWFVNGVEKISGIGLKEYSLVAGKNGQKTVVKVQVLTQDNDLQENETFFIPSIVDLVYESLSYVPPFYKGRSLNPNQGVVLVVAVPELIKTTGEKVPVKNIIYSWKKDGKVMQSDSGVGKNTFVFNGSVPINDVVIGLTASSIDGEIFASNQIKITNASPKIIFYENSPIYGIMTNKAITNTVKLLSDEFSVIAVPYFYSAGYATNPDLDYVWSMNGQTVSNQDPKNSFTSRVEKAGAGVASIGLKISNNVRIFQFSENSYDISFNKQ